MISKEPSFSEKRQISTTDTFKGIKNPEIASDGDILIANNFSSDNFPALSTSGIKRLYNHTNPMRAPGTLGADEKIFIAYNSGFIYDNVIYGSISKGIKNFAVLDDTIAIFPDKYYFSHKISYYYADSDGLKPFSADYTINDSIRLLCVSDSVPESAEDGDKYYNTEDGLIFTYSGGVWGNGVAPDTTNFYSTVTYTYSIIDSAYVWKYASTGSAKIATVGDNGAVGNDYLKISFFRSGNPSSINLSKFKVGDRVMIFGMLVQGAAYSSEIQSLSTGTEIVEIGDTYFCVKNNVGAVNLNTGLSSRAGQIMIKRIVPSLDCAVSVGDRIWGAKGSIIYACAPHDIFSWGDGNTIDSPVTFDSGIPGDIIGCADYGGVPVFFTENAIIKVLRVYNGYKISVTPAASLSKYNPRSIAFVSGSLYYVSDTGIMRYDGASPKKLDFEPDDAMTDMVAGTDGKKYYLSGKNKTYVYDPKNNLWYCDTNVYTSFARYGSSLAGIQVNGDYCFIHLITDADSLDLAFINTEKKYVLFAPFYENTISKKTYSKLIFKMKTDVGSVVTVKASFDGNELREIGKINGNGKICVHEFPLLPQRADYMQVSLETGNLGKFTLLSLTREYVLHDDYNR